MQITQNFAPRVQKKTLWNTVQKTYFGEKNICLHYYIKHEMTFTITNQQKCKHFSCCWTLIYDISY